MMCCQTCPFQPATDAAPTGCDLPRCPPPGETCHRSCGPNERFRCHQDEYVVRGLPTRDPLAVLLSPFSLDTACEGRDRGLLGDLLKGASGGLQERLWRRLGEHRERSAWLINPLLEASRPPEVVREPVPGFGISKPAIARCGQAPAAYGIPEEPEHRFDDRREAQHPMPVIADRQQEPGILAEGMRMANEQAYRRLQRAVGARDADALCELFLDVPAMLRSALWRYLLLFHAGDLDLLNPLFERNELPPLDPGDVPVDLGDYRQALWSVG